LLFKGRKVSPYTKVKEIYLTLKELRSAWEYNQSKLIKRSKNFSRFSLANLFAFIIAACGGGGGGEFESRPVRHSFYKFLVTFFNLLR